MPVSSSESSAPIGALAMSAIGGLILAAGVLAMFVPDIASVVHPALIAGKTPLGLIMIGLGLEAVGLKGVLTHAQSQAQARTRSNREGDSSERR